MKKLLNKTCTLELILFSAIIAAAVLIFSANTAEALVCPNPPISGNYTVSSDCAFSGNVNGVEQGNLTISSGYSLTITANQTLVFNSGFSVSVSGNIVASETNAMIRKTNLWMEDKDGDGWPATFAQQASDSAPPSGWRRRSLMSNITTTDCNDSSYSATNTCGASCTPSCGSCNAPCDGTGTQTCTNSDCSTYSQSCSGPPCGASCTPSCGSCSPSCGPGTQTCTSSDCSTYSQSWNYGACKTCNAGSWVNIGCGLWGCPATDMTQGRSWQWSDGSGECYYDAQCVAGACGPSCTPGASCGTTEHIHRIPEPPLCPAFREYIYLHYNVYDGSCSCVFSYEVFLRYGFCAN